MNKLEGIFVYDIDDLQAVAAAHMANAVARPATLRRSSRKKWSGSSNTSGR